MTSIHANPFTRDTLDLCNRTVDTLIGLARAGDWSGETGFDEVTVKLVQAAYGRGNEREAQLFGAMLAAVILLRHHRLPSRPAAISIAATSDVLNRTTVDVDYWVRLTDGDEVNEWASVTLGLEANQVVTQPHDAITRYAVTGAVKLLEIMSVPT